MATKQFEGQATAVAQVTTVQITNFDGGDTYVLTAGISPYTFAVSVLGNTDEDTTATNLGAAWNGATHPYMATVTATVATDTITLTADTPGAPFTVVSSVTGGGAGTIGAATEVTASEGPNHFMLAANWSTNTAPAAADVLIVAPDAPNICWDLDAAGGIGGAIAGLRIPEGITKIGLNDREFATSADGETTDPSKPEYRLSYLKFASSRIDIGAQVGPALVASPTTRMRIWNANGAGANMYVHHVRGSAAESGFPTLRLAFSDVGVKTLFVYEATGGVGIGVDGITDQANDLGYLGVLAQSTSTKVYTGSSTTVTSYEQRNGEVKLLANGTITLGQMHGGLLQTGDRTSAFKFTTLTHNGGTTTVMNKGAANVCADTLNGNGGTVDFTKIQAQTTVTTLNPKVGFNHITIDNNLTITTLNDADGPHTVSWT